MEDMISTLQTLMTRTESPKEKAVLKFAITQFESLHGKSRMKWSEEEYKRLPDFYQLEGEELVLMKFQGKGSKRWR